MHPLTYLAQLLSEADLVDVWRNWHPFVKQYTCVNVLDGKISSARLDRFYVPPFF